VPWPGVSRRTSTCPLPFVRGLRVQTAVQANQCSALASDTRGFGCTIADAVQASCSAYPFFERKMVNTPLGDCELIDGGFCANNPTLYALADVTGPLGKPGCRQLSPGLVYPWAHPPSPVRSSSEAKKLSASFVCEKVDEGALVHALYVFFGECRCSFASLLMCRRYVSFAWASSSLPFE
jgi:Patatin-like phospholipase